MNQNTTDFIEELKQMSEVLGIILFGSWARGNNRPDSDVDLVVILTEGYARRVEYKNNQAFEIIYTTTQSALEFWKNNTDDCAELWSVAKILYDKNGTLETLKEKAFEIIKNGKKPIDEDQKKQYQFSAEDEIKAVEHLITTDPTTASMVLTYAVNNLSSLFFDLRQLWTPAPKQRLSKIKEIDPKLYSFFERFYADKTFLREKIEVTKEIVPIVFKT
jgi:predicted nucleotidyltransferase